jgi:hypothetical protein
MNNDYAIDIRLIIEGNYNFILFRIINNGGNKTI